MDVPWDGTQFDTMCYTDLPVIYHGRGLADGEMPYVEAWNEYPVVSGLWQYAAASLSADRWDFFVVNGIGLGLVALAVTGLLYALVVDKRRVLLFAAAPPLALYAFHNWDLLAVGAATLGLYAYRRGWWAGAGAAFAVGASAKVWPGLFLLFLGLELLRDDRSMHGKTARFVGGATVTMLVLHVPFLLMETALYLDGYAWHLTRGPTYESWWGIARTYADRWGLTWVMPFVSPAGLGIVTKLLLSAGLVFMGVALWWHRLDGVAATFGAVLVFMTANQVFSVQYVVWLLPFFVVLERFPVWAALLLFLGDALVFTTVWPFFSALVRGDPDWFVAYARLAFASTFRFVVLWILIGIVVGWARRGDTAAPRVRSEGTTGATGRDVT